MLANISHTLATSAGARGVGMSTALVLRERKVAQFVNQEMNYSKNLSGLRPKQKSDWAMQIKRENSLGIWQVMLPGPYQSS